MLESFKNKVLELAKQAVTVAEETLAGETGKQKKIAAVKYVVTHLPVPNPIRYILGVVLSVFIDSAVEIAVAYMNKEVEG
ncbi:MAG: hypothetical protein NC390_01645 [Fusobacterium sp.]|nr:hypothetical protein [Fusobacterium sp.]